MQHPFILDFQHQNYPYFEEVNEGILKQINSNPEETEILDVGAGRCALGEVLCQRGYNVYAVDSNETIANEASKKVTRFINADLHDAQKIKTELSDKKFQYIIFSDVLEHVFDPLQVLRDYLPYLADDGKILISLPNAVNWLNRLRFMLGIFNYEMTGVMDRTHVRFFTFKSAKRMLRASQCCIEKQDVTPFITRAFLPLIKTLFQNKHDEVDVKSIVDSPYYRLYKKYVYPLEYWVCRLMPALFSFQIILVGRKANSTR